MTAVAFRCDVERGDGAAGHFCRPVGEGLSPYQFVWC